ncbi:MAG: hypothetical protein P4L82_05730 [Ancalomicrobiaceae bacterium]|nr:hypothetical protein [Ancalomicrobiaceae bacterium]
MALPPNAYLYEFLYRGQAAGGPDASSWHVIIAVPGTDAFGSPTLSLSPAMTPEQATALGMSLPDAIAGINAATLADLATARAELASAQARVAAP